MKRGGYSLIEVLAAVAIAAVAFGGIVGLLHVAGSSQRMAVNRIKMSLMARSILDEARLKARLGKEPSETAAGRHPFYDRFHYNLSTMPLDPFDREFLILLNIRWYPVESTPRVQEGEDPPQVTYTTIVCVE